DRGLPGRARTDDPEPVLGGGLAKRLQRPVLQVVQDPALSEDEPAAQRVVQDDRDGARLVSDAAEAEDRASRGEREEQECARAQRQEQELPQPDATGVLLLRAPKVPQ